MNRWLITVSIAVLAFAAACGDDDDNDDGAAGSGGSAGSAGSTGGSSGSGGGGGEVSCDPPDPPAVGAGGAGGEGGGAGLAPLAISGDYEDDFGTYTISNSQWLNPPATYHISAYDNDEHWVVARNDEGNEFGACLWSRFDWVETTDGLFYCTTVFDGDTEQDALDADGPDSSDPMTGGCGGASFPWTLLTPQ